MTETPPIEHEHQDGRGRYVMRFADGSEGELTYHERNGARVADHTGIPPHHRGGGHAALLVDRLVADAARDGVRIVPLCSYVEAQFRRHPEWAEHRA
ncbi:N-acetyltransferase [Arsenicitalea aurantiaca]|uniref:N-acetyltransferase n=1 Tax=Arsenicitalea aurantiaca TaxID=1783274 RepID=A0A433XK15_9HYPH|nr:GNAT family N-acetyltransferase [Arsenicitalea aurantiaca]RUT34420.1 N-acetyltransferase [Arsenicitalea aurantiaca]